jgi:hypothetical protein
MGSGRSLLDLLTDMCVNKKCRNNSQYGQPIFGLRFEAGTSIIRNRDRDNWSHYKNILCVLDICDILKSSEVQCAIADINQPDIPVRLTKCYSADRMKKCEMGGDVWGKKGCIWGFGGEAGGKGTT